MSIQELSQTSRRDFMKAGAGLAGAALAADRGLGEQARVPAQFAITLDLEMSRDYPQRGMREWDYRKGDLDEATKDYALRAARVVEAYGGRIHFFCVGRVLEQPDVDWLEQLAEAGHPIGNHTYDHVNVMAAVPEETQFRFRRAPWLVRGKTAADVISENIRMTRVALRERVRVSELGFRTPGGFREGLKEREDLQRLMLGLGYRWVSSKYPAHKSGSPRMEPTEAVYADIVRAQQHAQPFSYASGLIEIPMSPISDVTAFRSHYWQREWFLHAIRLACEWAIEAGGVFDFLAHPSCLVVEDPECESLHLICKTARDAGRRAEIVDLDTIARTRFPQ